MTQIPFSIYDVFGYLAAGFIVLAAADYAFASRWLLRDELTLVAGVFWLVAAYIAGHIVANVAGHLLEEVFVRRRLRPPEEVLFWPDSRSVCVACSRATTSHSRRRRACW